MEKRVLLIEDSPSQAAVTRLDLEKHGYEVQIAYDGPQGIAATATFEPSVIILDCNLPGMSGVEGLPSPQDPGDYPHLSRL